MSKEFTSGLSRRTFLRSLSAASVAAATYPALAGVQGAAVPQQKGGMSIGDMSGLGGWLPEDVVVISMNENPLGPAPSALQGIAQAAPMGNRYHGDIIQKTVSTATDMFGLKRGYVGLFPGSAGPLNLALASNIGPNRPLVYGDPSYEQGPSVADLLGVPKFGVKLTPSHACGDSERGRVLHCESEQPDRDADAEGRHRLAVEEQACGFRGDCG
jgi:histidinol-phosphate aminotransferase